MRLSRAVRPSSSDGKPRNLSTAVVNVRLNLGVAVTRSGAFVLYHAQWLRATTGVSLVETEFEARVD